MKKFPASNYVSPGRQNEPVDRRQFNVEAHGDKIVRATIQSFTTEEQDLVKANLNITDTPAITGVVRYDVVQNLTEAQQLQARNNINSAEFYAENMKLCRYKNGALEYPRVFSRVSEYDDPQTPTPYPEGVEHVYSFNYDGTTVYVTSLKSKDFVPTTKTAAPFDGTQIHQIVNSAWVNVSTDPGTDSWYYGLSAVNVENQPE